MSPEYSEYELEMQLVNNVRVFLIEMGGDFIFIGNQYRLVVGNTFHIKIWKGEDEWEVLRINWMN